MVILYMKTPSTHWTPKLDGIPYQKTLNISRTLVLVSSQWVFEVTLVHLFVVLVVLSSKLNLEFRSKLCYKTKKVSKFLKRINDIVLLSYPTQACEEDSSSDARTVTLHCLRTTMMRPKTCVWNVLSCFLVQTLDLECPYI